MATQTESYMGVRKQIIMSAPSRLLVGKYLSPKGLRLHMSAKTKAEKNAIWKKYGKNRYKINPDSYPVLRNDGQGYKVITHSL